MADAAADEVVTIPKMGTVIAGRLRAQILRGELSEGDVLPTESELMERYKIARPTLREAFRILEAESLLEIRRGRAGARVRKPQRELVARYAGMVLQAEGTTIADVNQARLDIEPPCARRLAENVNPKIVAALSKALELEAQQSGKPGCTEAGAHFHAEVVRLAGNQTLSLFGMMIEDITTRSNELLHRDTPADVRRQKAAHEIHAQLLAHIEAGAAEKAEALWREHLDARNKQWQRRLGVNRVVDILND